MASAYRPRHKKKQERYPHHHLINHTFTIEYSFNSPKQNIKIAIHTIPNILTINKFIITYYQQTTKQYQGYQYMNKLALLQCGDIEPNPGPMPDILRSHPTKHRQMAKTYFIPNTIKLHPEYQHLAQSFAPILKPNHESHQQSILTFSHLHQYIQTLNHPPPPHILYAVITTIDPSIHNCNNILAQPNAHHFNIEWTNTLINKLANLNNPPERHILTPHPYTKFITTHQDIIHPQNTIHEELYTFIHSHETPPHPTIIQRKFPSLPITLISESLRCFENINEYSHPPPLPNIPTQTTRTNINTNQETNIITWNASSLNTALPNLQNLISHIQMNTAIITIQETKLTATKSTKYIQNLFPQYKPIFNNTHAFTRCIHQRMPYTPGRGGLLTLIHNKYAFPGNITKIPTPSNISPYLQIIRINNQPLLPWLIIHMYMPTHLEDIHLIPNIQTTITNQITSHPNHIYNLWGDFNRDIALIGRQNDNLYTPPQVDDTQWKTFTTSLNLEYIPTNTSFSRQGGNNYTSTSLIDGFYIKSPDNSIYSCTTNVDMNLNSDHYPITLHIPNNTLIARTIPPTNIAQIRILNPIPPEALEKFNIKFFEENSIQIDTLTNILKNHDHLTHIQWQNACAALDIIIGKISQNIEGTCSASPLPQLTSRTAQQGGFLPRKIAKQWKKYLATYHLIRKTIYITKNDPNWHTHPILNEIQNHQHVQIPHPPTTNNPPNEWINEIATIAKTANKQARDITTKYTKKCILKAISKYRQLYEKSPKKVNRKVFKNSETSPLDSITDSQNNILTNPEDIAKEIHIQQSISNRPTVPTCHRQSTHPQNCTCSVRQYPWHDFDGFIIERRGEPQIPLHQYFDQATYDLCLKNLGNNKAPGPDKIPNSILKNMPPRFHRLLFSFFAHCYKQKQIPASWKTSLTVLLYKKGDPTQLTNHRPIALANTIYKLYTSTLTSILSAYGEKYQIMHDSQEGFRAERGTSRQLQVLIAALEDARLTSQDIYILYIDF